jgi:photosystem II stability/assembly factor-like uncharacterized protein
MCILLSKQIFKLMLKLNTAYLILLTCLLLNHIPLQSQNCSYTWSPQNSGTTNLLYTVKAVNEMICWAAGSNGTVRKTTDGGISWQNGNPNPGVITGDVLCIEALDETNAWATTSSNMFTWIYRTINGGNTWVQVYNSTNGFINGIKMESLTNGIALGDPIANVWNILRTTNGGLNWTLISTAPTAQNAAESGFQNSFHVSFPNLYFGSSFGSVYRSTNNGLTWSNHLTPGIAIYVLAVYSNSANLSFASGSQGMVKSTNAGENYSQIPVNGAGNIDNIDGAGNEVWYLRGQTIYYTTNAGGHWNPVHTTQSTMLDIDLVDNTSGCNTAWAVGIGGTVRKMTGNLVGINSNNSNLPSAYALHQNYPNPFNPATKISFSIPAAGNTELRIYDLLGNETAEVMSSYLTAGTYDYTFNAENLSSGIYIYKLTSGLYSASRKMILVK